MKPESKLSYPTNWIEPPPGKRDVGPIVWLGVIFAVVMIVTASIFFGGCGALEYDPHYTYDDSACTAPEMSITGAVVEDCSVESRTGFGVCRYRVIASPIDHTCYDLLCRPTCHGDWEFFGRICE